MTPPTQPQDGHELAEPGCSLCRGRQPAASWGIKKRVQVISLSQIVISKENPFKCQTLHFKGKPGQQYLTFF